MDSVSALKKKLGRTARSLISECDRVQKSLNLSAGVVTAAPFVAADCVGGTRHRGKMGMSISEQRDKADRDRNGAMPVLRTMVATVVMSCQDTVAIETKTRDL